MRRLALLALLLAGCQAAAPVATPSPTPAANNVLKLEREPLLLAAADLDGEGHDELLMATEKGEVGIVWSGRDKLQQWFTPPVEPHSEEGFGITATSAGPGSVIMMASPVALLAQDFDGDRRVDLACVFTEVNALLLYRNLGERKLADPLVVPVGAEPASARVGDANGDGLVDVVLSLRNGDGVALLENQGKGRFRLHAQPTRGLQCDALVADLARDGRPEVVACSGYPEEILRAPARPPWKWRRQSCLPCKPVSLVGAELDGKPGLDLVSDADEVDGFFNDGRGRLTGPKALLPLNGASHEPVDLDGDGLSDLLCTHHSQHQVWVARNRGGRFEELPPVPGDHIVAGRFTGPEKVTLIITQGAELRLVQLLR